MPSYAAFLGHQPHLSVAELAATVPGFVLKKDVDRNIVLFTSTAKLGSDFLDTLGGTVIIAEELDRKNPDPEDAPKILAQQLLPLKGKVTFSLRTSGLPTQTVKELYRKCKEHLRKAGKPSRYVGNAKDPAPSIVLRQEGLVDFRRGCELVILRRDEDDYWMGITKAAQNVDAYTQRDMKKPVRDTTTGLLPPKLAQILINLGVWLAKSSGAKTSADDDGDDEEGGKGKARKPQIIVFDPFCGTGVIPIECMMRRFGVLASDKSEKAVTGCQRNIEWVRKTYGVPKNEVPAAVWKQDAAKPFDAKKQPALAATPPSVIVTETSLGPALRKRPNVREAQKMRSESERLQEDFLENVAASLPGVPVVCIWPLWFATSSPILLEKAWKAVEKYGFSPMLPPYLNPSISKHATAGLPGGKRMSLIYRRADQFVGREIVLLKPKKK